MLRARRRGFFRRAYEITSDDVAVTTIDGARREGCTFTVDGVEYRVERDTRRRFVLHGPDRGLATADRATGREWTVKGMDAHMKLVRPSLWRSRWEIHQRGSARGTVAHEGMFGRAFAAEVPADVPVPLGVFAFYIVLLQFERAANAAAAG
ncbi:hypothetical protein [Actinophytocola sp. NPDC049390]|uniref:hypothetical protein n=1 Tax=Actinophytocola sp. NPDC049390 TaxID=3363894 RepID=UPI0037B34488